MKKHALAVLAYGVSTFVTQALSHFVVNKSQLCRRRILAS